MVFLQNNSVLSLIFHTNFSSFSSSSVKSLLVITWSEYSSQQKSAKLTRNISIVGPLSEEQREKLLKQREQYEKAAEKLEDQLMKLKEQREHLKAQGNKHEDNIMKENAKLQVRMFSLSIKQWLLTSYIAERSQVSDRLHEGIYGEDRQRPGRGRSGFR